MNSLHSRTRLAIPLAVFLFTAPSTVGAQPYPADGYVGVYFDRAGTQPCGNGPPVGGGMNTLYILALLAGAAQDGITGAEFRLEVSNSSGYFLTYIAAPGSCDLCLGGLDSTPCVSDAAGVSLAFFQCQASDPIAGPGRVFLGTINVVNIAGGPFTIETKRKNPASNPQFLCPSFTLCDVPQFTQVCTTIQEGEPALGGREPVAFRTVIGDPNCSGPPGCVIAVESHAWSVVKRLYRD